MWKPDGPEMDHGNKVGNTPQSAYQTDVFLFYELGEPRHYETILLCYNSSDLYAFLPGPEGNECGLTPFLLCIATCKKVMFPRSREQTLPGSQRLYSDGDAKH